MNIFIAERVIAACKQCLDGECNSAWGLCTNLQMKLLDYLNSIPGSYVDTDKCLELSRQLRWHVFAQWPLYSGNPCYPVPSASSDEMSCEAYYQAYEAGTLWAGEYGDLRRDLCRFTIDYLTRFYNLK